MALELRVMGGSQVLMAPQYGNKHGTLAIEPVSTRIVHKEVWEDFKVELAKKWMNYRDHDGTLLKSRVHWAKVAERSIFLCSLILIGFIQESPRTVTVEGREQETVQYWHQLYQQNMTEFFDILDKLSPGKFGIKQLNKNIQQKYFAMTGVGIQDIYNLFSNNYLDNLFSPQWQRFNVKRIHAEPQQVLDEEEKANAHQSECCAIV